MVLQSRSFSACASCRTRLLRVFLGPPRPRAQQQTIRPRRHNVILWRSLHASASRRAPSSVEPDHVSANISPNEAGKAQAETASGSQPAQVQESLAREGSLQPNPQESEEPIEQPPDRTLLDEIDHAPEPQAERRHTVEAEFEDEDGAQEPEAETLASLSNPTQLEGESDQDFASRKQLFSDIVYAMQENEESVTTVEEAGETAAERKNREEVRRMQDPDYQAAVAYLDYSANDVDAADVGRSRTHPLTEAGRFATFPSTIILPQDSMVKPVSRILSEVSNRHIDETAHKLFGGPHLPNSTATPSTKTGHLQQAPIALEASRHSMKPMEANLFLAAIWPGAYASALSVLVETRKRLGPQWLRGLLEKPGGPRILDAGSAGAAVLAWHEVLKAEWEAIRPPAVTPQEAPLGKATVVTASAELRVRASALLDNTTFLPRLPDFDAAAHLPSARDADPGTRKQYDVIVAPYTLWTLKEDYLRKAQVQNLWTLLDPAGGVLALLEKGVPRGFELIAGARSALLQHHIASPGAEQVEAPLDAPGGHDPAVERRRFISKETGMIVAPCTNHAACPMYPKAGAMQARKDYCHFPQRFERPPYLQRILGRSHENHEDIRFSYLVVRRGRDARRAARLAQDEAATAAAFSGATAVESTTGGDPGEGAARAAALPLVLPRTLRAPLKRHKHVVLDVCTPAGRVERWTVSAGLGKQVYRKQVYRDARKARWGDLWALGAKSRVVRRVRDGMPKDMPRRRVVEVRVGAGEGDDTLRDVSKGYRGKGRGHGVRRQERMKRVRETDLEG